MIFQVKELLSRIGARQEKGQTLIEYALIVLLISIVVILVLTALGVEIKSVFTIVKDKLMTAA
jgi:Flp pilus assembly pilin Flp